jgi:6-phosphogluconate dehydrogenase
MKLAMIGLGRMGGNMARRLRRAGIEVVGYARDPRAAQQLAAESGVQPATSLEHAIEQLSPPRIVWLMLPAGEVIEQTIQSLSGLLEDGDLAVDGGNSYYRDSQRRGEGLARHGIRFADVGTSGGIWGLEEGYCLMAGGTGEAIGLLEPALQALAPAPDRGWAHVGPSGAGHFVKMIHNGIEYGLMQAYAEGFALLRANDELVLDLAQIAELWRHGSVVRSWLLDLTAEGLRADQELTDIAPHVADSGEGRWTVQEAVERGVPAPVISLALMSRFASQDPEGYPNRLLAMMRKAFGGHAVRPGRGE